MKSSISFATVPAAGVHWLRQFAADARLHVLASFEPLLAPPYWASLQAASILEDRRANSGMDAGYLNSAERADGKEGRQ